MDFVVESNPYQLLNVKQTASLEEIKKQFTRLSLKYHPDRNSKSDPNYYKENCKAYTILAESKKSMNRF